MDVAVERQRPPWLVPSVLFVASFCTATWAQSIDAAHAATWLDALLSPWNHPRLLQRGLLFALTLLTIQLAHEMGHFVTARRLGVDQSPPYFIPAPTLFGTFGAVIFMRSQPPDRGVLMRIAVMGPYAGLVLAVPACIWGLAHSTPAEPGAYAYGSSLLFGTLRYAFAPQATYLDYHPVALAGWVGLLITSINLIPAAQLDGGHVAYALFGDFQETVSRFVVLVLFGAGLALAVTTLNVTWLVWSGVLYWIGLKHPPVAEPARPLRPAERRHGYLALVLFIITFPPMPVYEPGPTLPAMERLFQHGRTP